MVSVPRSRPQSDPIAEVSELLHLWYQEYVVGHMGSRISPRWRETKTIAESNKFDCALIESRVQQLAPIMIICKGLCERCQDIFDHWPENHDASLSTSYVPAIKLSSTESWEAAARAGCRFCAFILSTLKVESRLDLFRKIEPRLYELDQANSVFLSIDTRVRDEDPGMLGSQEVVTVNPQNPDESDFKILADFASKHSKILRHVRLTDLSGKPY